MNLWCKAWSLSVAGLAACSALAGVNVVSSGVDINQDPYQAKSSLELVCESDRDVSFLLVQTSATDAEFALQGTWLNFGPGVFNCGGLVENCPKFRNHFDLVGIADQSLSGWEQTQEIEISGEWGALRLDGSIERGFIGDFYIQEDGRKTFSSGVSCELNI